MSFLVYLFVLLVAASSVLFGMDWMQAPLQPPASTRTIQAASAPVSAPAAPAAQTVVSKPTTIAASVATTGSAVPSVTPVSVTAMPVAAAAPASLADDASTAQSGDVLKTEASEVKAAPLCDIAACERAYQTFTAADCTYKPFEGPRRLCMKGNPPPRRPVAQVAATEARAQAGCNVSVCASLYSSFDAATCTYQPFDGPRRVCTK